MGEEPTPYWESKGARTYQIINLTETRIMRAVDIERKRTIFRQAYYLYTTFRRENPKNEFLRPMASRLMDIVREYGHILRSKKIGIIDELEVRLLEGFGTDFVPAL